MSLLEVDGHHIFRRFDDGEKLPTPWDDPMSIRDSDVAVVHAAGQELIDELQPSHEAIEGLGWVMLATTTETLPLIAAA